MSATAPEQPESPGMAEEPADRAELAATPSDRRVAPRYHFRVPVTLFWDGHRSTGMVRDMSASGARIEEATHAPPEGASLHLEFSFFAGSTSVLLRGEVVRCTESGGFAVRFTSVDARKRELLRVLLPKVATARLENEHQVTTFSGQLVTSLGPVLHNACHQAARADGLTLNEWIKAKLQTAAQEAAEHGGHCDCPPCRAEAARGS